MDERIRYARLRLNKSAGISIRRSLGQEYAVTTAERVKGVLCAVDRTPEHLCLHLRGCQEKLLKNSTLKTHAGYQVCTMSVDSWSTEMEDRFKILDT